MLLRRTIPRMLINQNWIYIILFCFLWSAGLLFGRYITHEANVSFPALIRSVCCTQTSLIGLLAVILIPLLISVVVCRYVGVMWIFPVIFLKAMGFGFCSYAICLSFGDAGWLVRCLLMFTDCISVPLLLWFWIRRLFMKNNAILQDMILVLALLVVTACVDYMFVSPFLFLLIN